MVHQFKDHKIRNANLANDLHVGIRTDFDLSFPNKVDMPSRYYFLVPGISRKQHYYSPIILLASLVVG